MSHFTHMKTRFQNLLYLEKALKRLDIQNNRHNQTFSNLNSSFVNLVLPQSNGYDLEFCWNGQEYELIVDLSFWEQSYPVENFIDRIAQQYAGEVIMGESQKIGFQPVKYKQNSDGSNTLTLERWSEERNN